MQHVAAVIGSGVTMYVSMHLLIIFRVSGEVVSIVDSAKCWNSKVDRRFFAVCLKLLGKAKIFVRNTPHSSRAHSFAFITQLFLSHKSQLSLPNFLLWPSSLSVLSHSLPSILLLRLLLHHSISSSSSILLPMFSLHQRPPPLLFQPTCSPNTSLTTSSPTIPPIPLPFRRGSVPTSSVACLVCRRAVRSRRPDASL